MNQHKTLSIASASAAVLASCVLSLASCNSPSVRVLGRHTANVLSIAWSPDSRYLASSAWDSTVRIWDVLRGGAQSVLHTKSSPTYQVRWSAADSQLSLVTEETVEFWDPRRDSASSVIHLEPHGGTWMRVAWSQDGQRAAVYGWGDGTVRIQQPAIKSGPLVLRGHTGGQVATADWSADDRFLASGGAVGDRTVRIWDARTGRQLQVIRTGTGNWIAVTWAPKGSRLAWHGYSDHTVHVWDGPPYREISTLKHTANVEKIAWGPDGMLLVSADRRGALRLWNSVTGELVRKTPDVGSLVDVNFDAAWDAGTPYFAAVLDQRIVIWDTATGEMKERSVGEEPVVALAWSPDGRWLAAGGYYGSIGVWETAKLEGKSLR